MKVTHVIQLKGHIVEHLKKNICNNMLKLICTYLRFNDENAREILKKVFCKL